MQNPQESHPTSHRNVRYTVDFHNSRKNNVYDVQIGILKVK